VKYTSLILFICNIAFAQIANNSFFPNNRSINPGVAHLREKGFLSLESSKTSISKKQDILTGGILDGVSTDVELEKTTFFGAGKVGFMGIEVLADKENGTTIEGFETSSYERKTTTEGSSSVVNGVLDLGIVGVMLASANYAYDYDFHVDEPPNLNRETHKKELEYNLLRIGSAFEFKGISIGAFYSVQTAEGEVESILYNPTNGVPAPSEYSDLEYETISYGIGLGYVSKKYHFELSLEKITDQDLKQSNTYLYDENTPTKGQRLSGVAEVRFGKLSLGFRARQIEGGFADLEQLISSNMLYLDAEEGSSRLETSFNFAYGDSKGLSISGFYSTSNVETEEESDLLDNGETYDTTIETISYGVSLSYVF
jgi:hypothetical protein